MTEWDQMLENRQIDGSMVEVKKAGRVMFQDPLYYQDDGEAEWEVVHESIGRGEGDVFAAVLQAIRYAGNLGLDLYLSHDVCEAYLNQEEV